MILKPCPFCKKDIPRAMTVCPYCHRDEQGKPVEMDSAVEEKLADDRTLPSDLKALSSEDAFTRDQAIVRVAQRGIHVTLTLISLLADFAKPRLGGVAKTLGRIGDRRAIPSLAQAAIAGDEELRLASVWALAQFREPEVVPILLAEAARPHPVIQSFLANVLGTFQDASVVPLLSKLTNHANREVAFQAACALGEVGGTAAIPALQKAWHRKDVLVRAASAASLRKLGARPSRISLAIMVWGFAALAALGGGLGFLFYK